MTSDTPTWIPRNNPRSRLQQLPHLIDHITDSGGKPSTTSSPHRHSISGSKPPIPATILDLTGPHPALLRLLHTDATAILCPTLYWHTPTSWRHEVDLCLHHWGTDITDDDWQHITTTINHIYNQATQAAHITPPALIPCPQCGAPMDTTGMGPKTILICQNQSSHQLPGPQQLEHRWRHHPAMTSTDLCQQLPGLTPNRIKHWTKTGRLKPHTKGGGRGNPNTYFPWDILECMWPEIIAAINMRDNDKLGDN